MDVNEKAPDFTLPDENGESVTLSSFKGKPIALFFYPRANTPGCTVEAAPDSPSSASLPIHRRLRRSFRRNSNSPTPF
jgi:peroxiredoxin Q/BCP